VTALVDQFYSEVKNNVVTLSYTTSLIARLEAMQQMNNK